MYHRDTAAAAPLQITGPASQAILEHLTSSRGHAALTLAPQMIQWTHIQSVFVQLSLALDTSALPVALRLFLPLLLGAFFQLPVKEQDGTITSADDAIEALQQDTVSFGCCAGRARAGTFQPGVHSLAFS